MKQYGTAAIGLLLGIAGAPAWVNAQTSTTVTTVTSTSTTSSTIPACTDEATFDSTSCRLGELASAVATQPELAPFATKLGNALDKARRSVNLGGDQCDQGKTRTAAKRLKKAIRRMIQYGHRLRSLRARQKIESEEIRLQYVDSGNAIQQDLKALRKALVCPPASPSGAFL
jgi:hypothetical protein